MSKKEKKENSVWGQRLITVFYVVMFVFVVSYLYSSFSSHFG